MENEPKKDTQEILELVDKQVGGALRALGGDFPKASLREEQLDALIRDLTKQGFMSKSEVRERLIAIKKAQELIDKANELKAEAENF